MVTTADTKYAKVKNHEACAMAVACKRKLHLDGIIIARTKAYLIKGKRAIRFQVTESITREITAFDRGAEFLPGTYALSAIGKHQRLGRDKHSGPHLTAGKKLFLRHETQNIRAVLGSKKELD